MTSYSTVQKQQLSQLGAYLQEKRQEQEKSLEDISLQTYIRAQLLKALESGDTDDLPQPIFVQGFIRRYADALGLDGTNFSKQFPVHSIPNTPRPVAQPAAPGSMSYQTALQKPPIQTRLTKLKPAVGALPHRSTQPKTSATPVPSMPPPPPEPVIDGGVAAPADAADTGDMALDPGLRGPNDHGLNDLALGEPNNSTQAEDGSSSLFAQEAAVTLPPGVGALPLEPEPFRPGLSSGSTTNWLPWGIGAAVIVGAIALIASIINGGSNEPPVPQATEPPQAVVAQPETAQPETAQPEAAQPETAQPEAAQPETATQPESTTPPSEPEPDTTAAGDAPVNVSVDITEAGPSWMRVVVDGDVAFEGLLDPGTQQTWEGQESISINVGNAGAALISANGSEPAPAGNPGGAEFLTFTADE